MILVGKRKARFRRDGLDICDFSPGGSLLALVIVGSVLLAL